MGCLSRCISDACFSIPYGYCVRDMLLSPVSALHHLRLYRPDAPGVVEVLTHIPSRRLRSYCTNRSLFITSCLGVCHSSFRNPGTTTFSSKAQQLSSSATKPPARQQLQQSVCLSRRSDHCPLATAQSTQHLSNFQRAKGDYVDYIDRRMLDPVPTTVIIVTR